MVTPMVREMHEAPGVSYCIHHWLIETPDGPVSKGVCKYCREEKFFDNVLHSKYDAESAIRKARPSFIGEDEELEDGADDEEEGED